MIVVINDKVIDGVKVNEERHPVIPEEYLDSCMCAPNVWPYIYVPSLFPNNEVECELGYWDNVKLSKMVCPIVCNYVTLLSITISWKNIPTYDRITSMLSYYHYEILLDLRNEKSSRLYKFVSDDYMDLIPFREEGQKRNTMKCLFCKIIPKLNEFVSEGFPINQLNTSYVQSCFPLEDKDFINRCYTHDYSQFKEIIYSSKIEKTEGNYILEIGTGNMPFVNHHVGEIISSIIGGSFVLDSSEEFIYGIVTNLLEKVDYNESLLLSYCMTKLFFNAEHLYSSELANKEIMLAVPKSIDRYIPRFMNTDLVNPSLDVVKMFDFIYNMVAVHKIDGQYRAGRDDLEWEIIQFRFPIKPSYTPTQELINIINSALNIKLEQHIGCLFYSDTINEGYVSWLARKEDLGSDELKKSSMNKIFNRIYRIYLSDQSLFEKLVKN